MKVDERALQQIKKEIEGFKNVKMRAELTMEQIEKSIVEKKDQLANLGINNEEDLNKLGQEIEVQYDSVIEKVKEYREAVNK